MFNLFILPFICFFFSNSVGLQPKSDGLQPKSDGLQPKSDGLQPKSEYAVVAWHLILFKIFHTW